MCFFIVHCFNCVLFYSSYFTFVFVGVFVKWLWYFYLNVLRANYSIFYFQ